MYLEDQFGYKLKSKYAWILFKSDRSTLVINQLDLGVSVNYKWLNIRFHFYILDRSQFSTEN